MRRNTLDHLILGVCLFLKVVTARRRSNENNGEIVNWSYDVDDQNAVIHVYPSSRGDESSSESEITPKVNTFQQQSSTSYTVRVNPGPLTSIDLDQLFRSESLRQISTTFQYSVLQIADSKNLSTILPSKENILEVTTLQLSGLSLNRLESKLLEKIPNLQTLSILRNNAKNIQIDPQIGTLKNIRNINLNSVNLLEIPFINCSFASINLNFADNFITNFQWTMFENMFKRSKSVTIDFQNNPISCDNSWSKIIGALSSYDYAFVQINNALCSKPEELKGQEIANVDIKKLKPPILPQVETREIEIIQVGNFWALPCLVENEEAIFPGVVKEWKIGDFKVLSVGDDVIYKTPQLKWVAVDKIGYLVLKIPEGLSQQLNANPMIEENLITCTVFNAFFNKTISLKLNSQRSSQTDESATRYWPVSHVLAVLAAFLIAFLSIILMIVFLCRRFCTDEGSKFCSKRRRRNPNSISDDAVTRYSLNESARRNNSTTRFSRVADEPSQRFSAENPKSNGSTPTFSDVASHLEWDPQQSAELYITRTSTGQWNPRFEDNTPPRANSRSRHGSRLASTCSDQVFS